MQRKNSMFKKLKEKGYYIVLALCAVAVGVSGYLFCKAAEPKQNRRTVSATEVRTAARPTTPAADLPVAQIPILDPEKQPQQPTEPVPQDPEQTAPSTEPTDPAAEKLTAVMPLEGEILRHYSMDQLSYNDTTRDWRVHSGVDILAPEGASVAAAADGVVLTVYDDNLMGRTVTLRHQDGYVTHYANLAPDVPVMAGDKVTAGQTIGAVGATALLEIGSDPHLHFAVYRNNVPQDPEEFLGK